MPAHIPPGREDLWRRQAEADAEVRRLTDLYSAADKRAERWAASHAGHDPHLRALDAETERINLELGRAEAIAERIYQERTAGLTSWIDHDPTAPVCRDCKGTGGPPGHDAHGACKTCRGWGREHREPIPVWSKTDQEWINPATGRSVDLLGGSTEGTTEMSSIEEIRARIMQVAQQVGDVRGPIEQAIADTEAAIASLRAATEGTGQADASEAIGMLMKQQELLQDAAGMAAHNVEAVEAIGARL